MVGFDLGTTNSAVTYVDTEEAPWRVRTFRVPQLVAPGQIEARETLPSFHYEPAVEEFSAESKKLPWSREPPDHMVGFFARDHGTLVPGRLIASAKSWLCHSGVDRTAPLLPWHGAADVARLSPVDVSGRYLAHVRNAWDAQFPESPLAEQDLVLTLPASFDEVARELTVRAAAQAGLRRVVLIEEPQAAFYAWIDRHSSDWHEQVEPGQKILVCDIGGGTSDFTLIRVRADESGRIVFHRVAVGEHLILGGDNLDLALAHHLEARLSGDEKPAGDGKLEPRQWAVLVRSCRQVKETLLADDAPDRLAVNLPGSGSKLIGRGLQIEVSRDEVSEAFLEGFFPRVGLDEKPATRQSGFQEFGLPYTPDPAITRYLAAFLSAHRHVGIEDSTPAGKHDPARPDVVLFNGGLFLSAALRRRLLDVLCRWFRTPETPEWEPLVLTGERLDLAVARGAAYYGMVRRGVGVRIAAGLARTYYIGVDQARGNVPSGKTAQETILQEPEDVPEEEPPSEDPPAEDVPEEEAPSEDPREVSGSALCLVPAGVEPGDEVDLSGREFTLRVSEPVEFPLYVSSTRLTDRPGELVAVDREQMTPLPPIRTVLKTRKKGESGTVAVGLHALLTEIGTLDLWCSEVEGRRSWRLQFDVRSATETDVTAHDPSAEQEGFLDESTWDAMSAHLEATFAKGAREKPERLMKRLARSSHLNRRLWPTSLLRRLWEALMELEPGRRRSPLHEARWLNLLGFGLRPGYGLAVDDWRVAETWRVLRGKLVHPTPMCRAEWWILWRRIAGGLVAGQQQALADPVLALIRGMHKQVTTGKGRGGEFSAGTHEAAEVWRLLGSLELLPPHTKVELGEILLDLFPRRKMEAVRPAAAWALGRIGARLPVYGPLNSVVPVETVSPWITRFMKLASDDPMDRFAVMQLARRTGDRYRDLAEKPRRRAIAWLEANSAGRHFVELVRDVGKLDADEQGLVFGEALPKGLRIR